MAKEAADVGVAPVLISIACGMLIAMVLLGLGFAGAAHEAVWFPIVGVLIAGFFLGASSTRPWWLFTLCLTLPSLYFTLLGASEQFSKHDFESGRFALSMAGGILAATIGGIFLGRFLRKAAGSNPPRDF